MLTQEVVVASPERPGVLARVFKELAQERIEVLGVATETYLEGGRSWRRVRLLFRDTTGGAATLKNAGFTVKVHDVVYLQVEASVTRLDWALSKLQGAGIEVEAIYHAYAPGGPGLVLVTESPGKAAELL